MECDPEAQRRVSLSVPRTARLEIDVLLDEVLEGTLAVNTSDVLRRKCLAQIAVRPSRTTGRRIVTLRVRSDSNTLACPMFVLSVEQRQTVSDRDKSEAPSGAVIGDASAPSAGESVGVERAADVTNSEVIDRITAGKESSAIRRGPVTVELRVSQPTEPPRAKRLREEESNLEYATSGFDINGYDIIREIGRGAMATVYLAIQKSLERKVAIKVCGRSNNKDVRDRFVREARIMARLSHRNLCAVYNIGVTYEAAYLVMEHLPAGSLYDRMGERISVEKCVAILIELTNGLYCMHESGIVHRDLKPANIIFRDESTPVLVDFGISKTVGIESDNVTGAGVILGTPAYMAPEQINNVEIDNRADIYSLGAMAYEMLMGYAPFESDTPLATLMGHLTTPPAPLFGVDERLAAIIERMLAKERESRFESMRDVGRALGRLGLTDTAVDRGRVSVQDGRGLSEAGGALGVGETLLAKLAAFGAGGAHNRVAVAKVKT